MTFWLFLIHYLLDLDKASSTVKFLKENTIILINYYLIKLTETAM